MNFVEGGGLGGTVDGPVEGDETGGESGFGRMGGFGPEFESDGGELGAVLFELVVSGRRDVLVSESRTHEWGVEGRKEERRLTDQRKRRRGSSAYLRRSC